MVVVLDTESQPIDFGFKRFRARVRGGVRIGDGDGDVLELGLPFRV